MINKYVDMIINLMIATLWRRLPYLASSEIDVARNYIRSLFYNAEPNNYKQLFNELNLRTVIVAKYLEKDKNRYVPIPSVFFDSNRKFNFQRSKVFLEQHRQKRKELQKDYQRFVDKWNDFVKAVNIYLKDDGIVGYKKGDKFLRKKHPELSDAYRFMVLNKIDHKIKAA